MVMGVGVGCRPWRLSGALGIKSTVVLLVLALREGPLPYSAKLQQAPTLQCHGEIDDSVGHPCT
jgi:hypothetical protein